VEQVEKDGYEQRLQWFGAVGPSGRRLRRTRTAADNARNGGPATFTEVKITRRSARSLVGEGRWSTWSALRGPNGRSPLGAGYMTVTPEGILQAARLVWMPVQEPGRNIPAIVLITSRALMSRELRRPLGSHAQELAPPPGQGAPKAGQ
jgi:hypothetical protein